MTGIFQSIIQQLLNTFVIASLSMAAIILSWGICCNNSFCFCRIVGSKRVIVSFSNAVTSTVSNFNSNLLAPIFENQAAGRSGLIISWYSARLLSNFCSISDP